MGPTLVFDTKSFAIELYSLLKELDPVKWKEEKKHSLKSKILRLETEVNRLYSELHEFNTKVQKHRNSLAISEKLHNLRELLSELKNNYLEEKAQKESFHNLRKRMEVSYQELASNMEPYSVKLPQIRPTNYARYAFHILSALFTLSCIEFISNPLYLIFIALAFSVSFWIMELLRVTNEKAKSKIKKFFNPVAHPDEGSRVCSSTWFTSSLVLLSLTQSITLCAIGVTVLGLSDPAAAAVGRKFGKTKLPGGRSLEGSATFFIVGTIATFLLLNYFHHMDSTQDMLVIAASAGLLGALGELLGSLLDDNITIPLSSALGAFMAMSLI